MTFKKWFLGLTDNEKVAFFGLIGCGLGGGFLAIGQTVVSYPFTGLGLGFLVGGFFGILFLGNSES